jgi:DNA polymerase-3 subunit chi
MTTALFYHLTRSTPAETLAMLLPRALGRGMRVMLRGTDPQTLDHIDRRLWEDPEDGFLPHGREGGPQDADQPVLIGQGPIRNGAEVLALIDGAEPLEAELAGGPERIWVFFDGGDEAAVSRARGLWSRLVAAGLGAQYWAQDGGNWQMKTERKPPEVQPEG